MVLDAVAGVCCYLLSDLGISSSVGIALVKRSATLTVNLLVLPIQYFVEQVL